MRATPLDVLLMRASTEEQRLREVSAGMRYHEVVTACDDLSKLMHQEVVGSGYFEAMVQLAGSLIVPKHCFGGYIPEELRGSARGSLYTYNDAEVDSDFSVQGTFEGFRAIPEPLLVDEEIIAWTPRLLGAISTGSTIEWTGSSEVHTLNFTLFDSRSAAISIIDDNFWSSEAGIVHMMDDERFMQLRDVLSSRQSNKRTFSRVVEILKSLHENDTPENLYPYYRLVNDRFAGIRVRSIGAKYFYSEDSIRIGDDYRFEKVSIVSISPGTNYDVSSGYIDVSNTAKEGSVLVIEEQGCEVQYIIPLNQELIIK
jgi:hypothetical protein